MKTGTAVFAFLLATTTLAAQDADWPQWRGPERTGLSSETGLLRQWPAQGPPRLWSIDRLGQGYGTVALEGGSIYVQGTRNGSSVLFSLDSQSGETRWVTRLGPAFPQQSGRTRGNGPRGTPTVEGDRVYVLSENGDLACLDKTDGAILWSRNILRDFQGGNPRWLLSESPLVSGDRVIVTPGGPDAALVALDKRSGETVWTSEGLSDPAAYSSALPAEVGGVAIILAFTDRAAVGVRASDGKPMWRYPGVANRTANIPTPLFHDGKAFFTSAYDTGAVLLDLRAEGDTVTASEVYFTRNMQNHHGGVVLVDGYVYGFSNSILTCLEFETGRQMWRHRSVGKGSLTYADSHLYLLSENNVVGLAEATPAGYRERGRFTIADQGWPAWAHPVVSGGRLYIRNQAVLESYDIRR